MGILDAPGRSPQDLHAAAEAMESLMLQQVLRSSGAFHGSALAGSGIRSDLFVEAMAEAVAKAGGIGLAAQLERSLSGQPVAAPPAGFERRHHLDSPHIPAASRPPLLNELARPMGLPVSGVITSGFGARSDPFNGHEKHHAGVDFAAAEGTPIHAAGTGTVVQAGPRGGYGLAVEVQHPDGSSTLYAHASELLVTAGQTVHQGQPVAKVGHTGRATGPHLHFELRQAGQAVDPSRALKVYRNRADMAE